MTTIIVILLAIIFTLTINNVANRDSPLEFNGAVRIGYTQSELQALETIYKTGYDFPITDLYYNSTIRYIINEDNYKRILANKNTKILIQRNYYLNNPEWNEKFQINTYEFGIIKYNTQYFIKEYHIDRAPFIYNNGNVKAYFISVLNS